VSGNIRLRAALCLVLSLVDLAKARADEPLVRPHEATPVAAAPGPGAACVSGRAGVLTVRLVDPTQ
jgi:hypothetical protein